jgi:hypothetical protein
MTEIVKFPYSTSRHVVARRPRRSKNGKTKPSASVTRIHGTIDEFLAAIFPPDEATVHSQKLGDGHTMTEPEAAELDFPVIPEFVVHNGPKALLVILTAGRSHCGRHSTPSNFSTHAQRDGDVAASALTPVGLRNQNVVDPHRIGDRCYCRAMPKRSLLQAGRHADDLIFFDYSDTPSALLLPFCELGIHLVCGLSAKFGCKCLCHLTRRRSSRITGIEEEISTAPVESSPGGGERAGARPGRPLAASGHWAFLSIFGLLPRLLPNSIKLAGIERDSMVRCTAVILDKWVQMG